MGLKELKRHNCHKHLHYFFQMIIQVSQTKVNLT